jgi:hypothetical protein
MTRTALLDELEELKRKAAGATRLLAKAAVMGTRVAMRGAKSNVYIVASSGVITAE